MGQEFNTLVNLDELEVTQARGVKITVDEIKNSVAQPGQIGGVNKGVEDGRFAVTAPYWLDGLHNHQGIALAEEINQMVKKNKLEEDQEVISILLVDYPNAKRFGLEVVPKSRYLEDLHRNGNAAEPRSLLDGAFVRDKEGAYRPSAGGRAVVVDKGDSLVLKSKSAEGYRAAMELAIAKGWTAIELKGKPAMLAEAWIEAKMKGLDVVNYSPTKEDLAKYSGRLAEEKAAKTAAVEEHPIEQSPERVEIRNFVDANGKNKVASVVYTLSFVGGEEVEFDNPKDAARAFAEMPDADRPMVLRSMVRVDGEPVNADIIAVTTPQLTLGSPVQMVKRVEGLLDQEFNEAFSEVIATEKAQESLEQGVAGVSTGKYSGKILAIEGGQVVQKVGRGADEVVRHDISKLTKMPKIGAVADIHYSSGRGVVKEKELDQEREIGLGM